MSKTRRMYMSGGALVVAAVGFALAVDAADAAGHPSVAVACLIASAACGTAGLLLLCVATIERGGHG